MAKLSCLDVHGDMGQDFTKKDYAKAKATFDQMVKDKGYFAFATDRKGESEIIRDFDPDAEEIVLVKRVVGG